MWACCLQMDAAEHQLARFARIDELPDVASYEQAYNAEQGKIEARSRGRSSDTNAGSRARLAQLKEDHRRALRAAIRRWLGGRSQPRIHDGFEYPLFISREYGEHASHERPLVTVLERRLQQAEQVAAQRTRPTGSRSKLRAKLSSAFGITR